MIELISFVDDRDLHNEKRITFNAYDSHRGLSSAVPRQGELVVVRQVDQEMIGTVRKVDWYFSSGNYGAPVITIYLNTVEK